MRREIANSGVEGKGEGQSSRPSDGTRSHPAYSASRLGSTLQRHGALRTLCPSALRHLSAHPRQNEDKEEGQQRKREQKKQATANCFSFF